MPLSPTGNSAEHSAAASVDRCECGADAGDISFDRSICACGSMHYFCNQCGTQAEPCADKTPEPPAARSQRFTVEGDPTHVRELAEAEGWKIAYPRWWQRTYAIPRWIVWLVVAHAVVGLPRAIEQVTTWL